MRTRQRQRHQHSTVGGLMCDTHRVRVKLLLMLLLCICQSYRVQAQHDKLFRVGDNGTVIEGSYIVVLNQTALDLQEGGTGSSTATNSNSSVVISPLQDVIDTLMSMTDTESVLLDRLYNRSSTWAGFSISVQIVGDGSLMNNSYGLVSGGTIRNGYMRGGSSEGSTSSSTMIQILQQQREEKLLPLLDSPFVQFIEEDQLVFNLTTENNPTWGIDRIDQDTLPLDGLYHYTYDGTDVDAYVIDTGIRTTHDEFDGRASCAFNAIQNEDCDDQNGHGTHVSGTIGGRTYGVAKNVNLLAIKVLDKDGSGSNSGVIDGVNFFAERAQKSDKPIVGNMSLGGIYSSALNSAANAAVAAGGVLAAASGNSGISACLSSPSVAEDVISVAATDNQDNRADFSNKGSCVDIFGPGVDITSSWNGNDQDTNTISGTSMATPHIAGAAVLIIQQFPDLNSYQVKATLLSNAVADQVGDPEGAPNLLVRVNNFAQDLNPDDGTTSQQPVLTVPPQATVPPDLGNGGFFGNRPGRGGDGGGGDRWGGRESSSSVVSTEQASAATPTSTSLEMLLAMVGVAMTLFLIDWIH